MNPRTYKLGPLEMEVMALIKPKENTSVAEIQTKLKDRHKNLAYTTVMTILFRLFKKGFLIREKNGKQYFYRRAHRVADLGKLFLSKIAETFFHNQNLKPVLALLDDDESLTKQDLIELKKAINAKLKQHENKE